MNADGCYGALSQGFADDVRIFKDHSGSDLGHACKASIGIDGVPVNASENATGSSVLQGRCGTCRYRIFQVLDHSTVGSFLMECLVNRVGFVEQILEGGVR